MRNILLTVVCVCLAASLGCSRSTGKCSEEKGEHKAIHGGVLNALTTCENGHAEVKLEGDVMKLWFVGGGSDTDKAVRVPDNQIVLTVTGNFTQKAQTLLLAAKPNDLADEKFGDCSRFEGQADWLKNANEFVATGAVRFKGKQQAIRIEYPKGYDPD